MEITLQEWVSVGSDVVVAVAAGATAYAAVRGLRSWRRELEGRAHFDVARGLIKAAFRLRNELERARSRFIHASEFPETFNVGSSSTPPEETARAYGHMFARRWEPIWPALQEFDAYSLDAEVLWGENLRTAAQMLRDAVAKLRAATDAYVANEESGGEDFKTDRNFGQRIRNEVFETYGEAVNPLSQQVAAAVTRIEDEVRPYFRRGRDNRRRVPNWLARHFTSRCNSPARTNR